MGSAPRVFLHFAFNCQWIKRTDYSGTVLAVLGAGAGTDTSLVLGVFWTHWSSPFCPVGHLQQVEWRVIFLSKGVGEGDIGSNPTYVRGTSSLRSLTSWARALTTRLLG